MNTNDFDKKRRGHISLGWILCREGSKAIPHARLSKRLLRRGGRVGCETVQYGAARSPLSLSPYLVGNRAEKCPYWLIRTSGPKPSRKSSTLELFPVERRLPLPSVPKVPASPTSPLQSLAGSIFPYLTPSSLVSPLSGRRSLTLLRRPPPSTTTTDR